MDTVPASGCNITIHFDICIAVVIQICRNTPSVCCDASALQLYIAVIVVDGDTIPACNISVHCHLHVGAAIIPYTDSIAARSFDTVHSYTGITVFYIVNIYTTAIGNNVPDCYYDITVLIIVYIDSSSAVTGNNILSRYSDVIISAVININTIPSRGDTSVYLQIHFKIFIQFYIFTAFLRVDTACIRCRRILLFRCFFIFRQITVFCWIFIFRWILILHYVLHFRFNLDTIPISFYVTCFDIRFGLSVYDDYNSVTGNAFEMSGFRFLFRIIIFLRLIVFF